MALLVVGMHRSGTSAVSRTIAAAGLPTAGPDLLMGADDSNRMGHWEIRELTDFNDELLALVGAHWAAPVPIDAGALRGLVRGAIGDRARRLLTDSLPDDGRWFWKDPRLSLLLPFWTEILPAEPAVVHVVRRPGEVADSLRSRNGTGIEYGLALWERYTRQAVIDSAGLASHVVSFERLFEDPTATVDALIGFLGEQGLIETASPGADEAVVAAERHARGDDHELSPQQRSLFEEMNGARDGPQPRSADLPPATPGLAGAFDSAAEIARITSIDVQRLRRELLDSKAEAQSAVAEVQAELADARATAQTAVDQAHADLETAQGEARAAVDEAYAELEAALTDFQERAEGATAHIDHLESDLAAARETAVDLQATRRDLALALSEARAHVAGYDHLDTEVAHLRALLDAEIGSNAHQAIALYRRVAGRAMPVETRRGRAYRQLLGVARAGGSRAIGRARTVRAKRAGFEVVDPEEPLVVLDRSAEPVASIVIPVHGEWEVTRHCLNAIQEHTQDIPYEVIVVDDCSPDATDTFLANCEGIEVVTNEVNLGYLRSTNAGAELARGDFVVLLNNDTAVTAGWLEALLSTFERGEDVGLVGAKLVYPTGELQEAGAIIWSDGSGWNYGRGGDPADFRFQYVREVDYCSAACLAVRRELWKHLGGFDEQYVPAYYEDADLAFRARRAGHRVMYQPAARVIHHEGVSHGTDESSGHKAYQVRNRARFVDTWTSELTGQHRPDPSRIRQAADRATGPSLLVVDHQMPAPDRDAGSLRMSLLLEFLVDMGYRVRFFPANAYQHPPYEEPLQQLGIEVAYGAIDSSGYLDEIDGDVDIAILSRPLVAVGWMTLLRERIPDCKVVYDMVDYHGLRETRRADLHESEAAAHQADILGELEAVLASAADLTLAVSDTEAEALAEHAPGAAIATVPTVHERPLSPTEFDARAGLLFVGSWAHPPNRDAIDWLASELGPALHRRLPGVVMHIVGSDVPPDVAADSPYIEIHGWVPDLDDLFDQVRVSIAPLRFGAGVKGKIGDSLARGVPVVTTSIGAEGFEFDGPFELMAADGTDAFVDAVVELYTDAETWSRQATEGRLAVHAAMGTGAVATRLGLALERLGSPSPS